MKGKKNKDLNQITRKVSKACSMIDTREDEYIAKDYEHVDSLIEQYQSGKPR